MYDGRITPGSGPAAGYSNGGSNPATNPSTAQPSYPAQPYAPNGGYGHYQAGGNGGVVHQPTPTVGSGFNQIGGGGSDTPPGRNKYPVMLSSGPPPNATARRQTQQYPPYHHVPPVPAETPPRPAPAPRAAAVRWDISARTSFVSLLTVQVRFKLRRKREGRGGWGVGSIGDRIDGAVCWAYMHLSSSTVM